MVGDTTACVIGVVAALSRFPVKSMAGEPLAEVELRWPGMHGDRQYGFCRLQDQSRFPWLSARDLSGLVLYKPAYRDPGDPRNSPVNVVLASGDRLPVGAPALAAQISREARSEVRLMQVGRGIFDAMPVSLASTASLAAIDAAHGKPLDVRRFRLNIIIQSEQGEMAWRSGRLLFGEDEQGAQLLVNAGIPRCALITIDPETAERDPSVMRTVAGSFDNEVGVYCATAKPGTIRVGDRVRLFGQETARR
ncbi:MOSC domain-containing protein [Roseomonas hellenica]|uniref:MOSC domain-containing protein n=1 Tax=Plastoroseomonas hellenica TaxID=2687306 RepID=A0ABS5F1Y5_9PROT|nr:MOSC domain-containing protein [Plastoroseomonas hellenica]MBR0666135.1 MOSC domain-containing protein [Plastoroseomonas hellenica]